MKIKTSDLAGLAFGYGCRLAVLKANPSLIWQNLPVLFMPFKDWSQGGPIIESERMEITPTTMTSADSKYAWEACKFISECELFVGYGPTPLIAAMRCFVASKLGDSVEVPNELMETT